MDHEPHTTAILVLQQHGYKSAAACDTEAALMHVTADVASSIAKAVRVTAFCAPTRLRFVVLLTANRMHLVECPEQVQLNSGISSPTSKEIATR